MKTRICLVLFLFVAIVGKAQLSNDEKIQMLQTANQSSAVIEKAMQNSYSIEEIDQANKLKKEGIKEETIIYVLINRIKLTSEDIAKLKDYQAKGYSDSIIQKSLEDKPKFEAPSEKKKDDGNKKEKKSDNSSSSEFKRFDLQVVTSLQYSSVLGDFYVPIANNAAYTVYTYSPMTKFSMVGLEAGISFGFHFNKNMGISLGTLYSGQGQDFLTYNVNYNDGTSTYPIRFSRYVTLSYLKTPIQFNFNTNPDKRISFSSFAGFYFGFLTYYYDYFLFADPSNAANNETYTATGTTYTDKWNGVNYNHVLKGGQPYNSFDFGATVGAGISFRLNSRLSIPLVFNYQIGFTDIKNYACYYTDTGVNYKFWQYWTGDATDFNYKEPYYNSLFGFKTGLKINL